MQAPRGGRRLRSETTTTGGCPAISGATPAYSFFFFGCPRWPGCLLKLRGLQCPAVDDSHQTPNKTRWPIV